MLDLMLFAVWPYVAVAVCLVGLVWRWRVDQFGWTTLTSLLSEKRILNWASPLFHVGALLVILGHVAGLLIPKAWTVALGVPPATYHLVAVSLGVVAGAMLTVGTVALVLRRFILRTRLRLVTRRGDIVMYVILGLQIVLGLWQTIGFTALEARPSFDYRDSVSLWFRSIFVLQPDVAAMTPAPWAFKAHAALAFALIAVWPFSRLVHVFSIPIGYLTRPAIVYRHQGS
ncbi:MAG: respiratory nitrate reductase subunit gamma [Propionibacteriaceae bacterium]|jgi:nitrate reductase gamma subunit|nr:respiratory nitrate reductase subunit gamma [Propionibacteriaceae bacterium]